MCGYFKLRHSQMHMRIHFCTQTHTLNFIHPLYPEIITLSPHLKRSLIIKAMTNASLFFLMPPQIEFGGQMKPPPCIFLRSLCPPHVALASTVSSPVVVCFDSTKSPPSPLHWHVLSACSDTTRAIIQYTPPL